MLMCINPDVKYKSSNGNTFKCMAVSLKWFLSLLQRNGDATPPEERIRNEIKALGIGDVSKKRQYFNKTPDGSRISRAAGENTCTIPKTCVVVKHSAFSEQSWATFSNGNMQI